VFVRNHCLVVKWSVICMFLNRCNSPKIEGAYVDDRFLTDPAQPRASGLTVRDRLSLVVLGKFRSSLILSLNPFFSQETRLQVGEDHSKPI
jgi:hypothetical protein